MDIEKNILMAKKYLVHSIYSSVEIEGIAMTFPETKTIIQDGEAKGKDFRDVHFVTD